MSALPAAAAATLAPDYLAAQLVRGARTRSLEFFHDSVP